MSAKKLLFFIFLLLAFSRIQPVFSQCCSTGSPVGASVYVGILGKNTLRAITYYRHSYSDSYYEGDSRTTENNQLKSSNYNFVGVAIAYGITRRLTLESEFGYFINKTQVFNYIDYSEKGFGLSNGGVIVKYSAFLKPSKELELTFGAGFRYPFSSQPQENQGVQLSRDVQPSTNAFAVSGLVFFNKGFPSVKLRFFSINRYDYNFEDKQQYRYGNILLNSVFVSKQIIKYFSGILQVRSEYRWEDEDQGEPRSNTGNWMVVISPTLSYAIAGKWNISALYDIPVYKHYNGKQLTPKYSIAVSLTRNFDLSKHPKTEIEVKSIH